MSWGQELKQLKAEKQELFERKQAAWHVYDEAKKETQKAHDAMQEAWRKRNAIRDEMNCEFEKRKSAFEQNDVIWAEFKQAQCDIKLQIDGLQAESDAEHLEMVRCFETAKKAFNDGDRASASAYSSEGHDHKDKRDSLNAEVSALVQKIRDARARAETATLDVDSSAFKAAKERFETAKKEHQAAEDEFMSKKQVRNEAKAEFDRLQAKFTQANDAYNAKKTEILTRK